MEPKTKLVFELTWQMVQIISAALQELPFRVASPVLAELQKQINDQVASDNVVPMSQEEKAS